MADEGCFIMVDCFNGDWADYRWEDGFNGYTGGQATAEEIRQYNKDLHAISNRIKSGHYGITVAADINSPILNSGFIPPEALLTNNVLMPNSYMTRMAKVTSFML